MLSKSKHKIIEVSRADYAQRMLWLEGKPFSVEAVPYMKNILNCDAEKVILMTGRQVGKSTTLSANILVEQTAIPHYRTLYVAPRNDQVTQFSGDRLSQMITHSPMLQKYFVDSKVIQQSRAKQFMNGSMTYLRSCYHTADGIRGISANSIFIDEVQDIILDNIPVIEECSARKNPKRMIFCGTPKTFDNAIQKIWEQSTQHYWAIKCPHCNHWNVPIKEDNLCRDFLGCAKCKKEINAVHGEYVGKYPDRAFVGFHISQAMVAGVPGTNVPWNRLYEKVDNPLYSASSLYNECLGFSYDSGSKLVTESELRNCCDPETTVLSIDRKAEWGIRVVCAGVDWGVLGGNTHTVLTIGGMDCNGNLRILFTKKFPVDQDPTSQVDEIAGLINRAGCAVVAADRGGGVFANGFLKKKLSWARLHEIEYKAKVNAGMQFNKDAQSWMTDRTRAMAGVISDIKNCKLVFPDFDIMREYFSDVLTLACENNEKIRCFQIIREMNTPDDFAHTLSYLRIAAKKIAPAPSLLVHELDTFQPPDKHQGGVDENELPSY
ncbi:MAG: phage terminase large subunit family protein [Candidatus Cloacimonetes bacterium]|nr:phage terminase large subunit family protein [Candidatus Cloacimonadota bacterium]